MWVNWSNGGWAGGGEVYLVRSMKAFSDSRGIAPPILNRGACWRWVVSITLWLFFPSREGTPVRMGWGGPHNRSGRFGEEKNFLILLGFEPRTVWRTEPGWLSRYSDSLRAGRSGDRIPVGARYSAPVQTGFEVHPVCYTVGSGSSPGGKTAGAWRWPPTPN